MAASSFPRALSPASPDDDLSPFDECPICLDQAALWTPSPPTCGHRVCVSCARKMVRHRATHCPTCRACWCQPLNEYVRTVFWMDTHPFISEHEEEEEDEEEDDDVYDSDDDFYFDEQGGSEEMEEEAEGETDVYYLHTGGDHGVGDDDASSYWDDDDNPWWMTDVVVGEEAEVTQVEDEEDEGARLELQERRGGMRRLPWWMAVFRMMVSRRDRQERPQDGWVGAPEARGQRGEHPPKSSGTTSTSA